MQEANERVKSILDHLEPRIDVAHVRDVAARHRAVLDYEEVDRLPLVISLPYEGGDFLPYPYLEAFADPAKMMVNQLLQNKWSSIYENVDLKDDAPCCLRANVGCVIIASMFGAAIKTVENAMPWIVPFESKADIQAIVDAPLPDLGAGLLPQVLEHYAYFHAALVEYPNCGEALQITLPDLQGPFDTAELLWGSDIYLAFYDPGDSRLMAALMEKITDLMLVVYDRLQRETRENLGSDYHYRHAAGQKGKFLICQDSVTNISPDHYREVIQPVDTRLTAELNVMGFHSCGRVEHHLENWVNVPGMCCVDVGQPERNDLDVLYSVASAREVPLTRMIVPEEKLTIKQTLERFPTGVSLLYKAETVAEGHRVWERYCDSA